MDYIYKYAALGGTFDHFHAGHEQFVAAAFACTEKVIIGVVQKSFSPEKALPNSIEEYSTRVENLRKFLDKHNFLPRAEIIPIKDIYGPTLTDPAIEAIFVTASTRANAKIINIERQKRSLPPMEIIEVPFLQGNDGNITSSQRIRAGETDRQGNSYLKFINEKETCRLPDSIRNSLKQPIGKIFQDVNEAIATLPKTELILSVGDIVSISLKDAGCTPAVSIIDYKTRRQELEKSKLGKYFPVIAEKLSNPPGTINKEIANTLTSSINTFRKTGETQVIAVGGEEDLLALPAILLAPLHSYVIYGQFNVGMIVVEVTEEKKSWAKTILGQF